MIGDVDSEFRQSGTHSALHLQHVPAVLHLPLHVPLPHLALPVPIHLTDGLYHPPLGLQDEVVILVKHFGQLEDVAHQILHLNFVQRFL